MLGLFKSFTKPFVGGDNLPQGSRSGLTADARPGDRLEDGFLLVGQTSSERTTVHASQFDGTQVQAPPGYLEVRQNECLPTYQDYTANVAEYSHLAGNTGNCPQVAAPGEADSIRFCKTPVADIPFSLGPSSEIFFLSNEIKSSQLLTETVFKYSDYEYDFDVESSFLTAYESMNNSARHDRDGTQYQNVYLNHCNT